LEKVVLARRGSVVAEQAIDVAGLLARLRARFPSAAVFAVRRGGRTFVGASPERLVAVQGKRIRASAVAGTSRPSDEAGGDGLGGAALLADPKERREHAMVVEALRSALAPVCQTLDVPGAPELMALSNLHHLYTPLSGTLTQPLTALEAVSLLHPTPAVGGVPVREAMASIREWEPFDRGWFAGPIGWMDDAGNGEFFVALRAALVEGDRAYLYAGCGLVEGSDAAAEWSESALKMGAVLCAL
jgi:isochorismate synthase